MTLSAMKCLEFCGRHQGLASYLVFDREVDEIGIHQHMVGGPKLRVILEEKRCGHLLPASTTNVFAREQGWRFGHFDCSHGSHFPSICCHTQGATKDKFAPPHHVRNMKTHTWRTSCSFFLGCSDFCLHNRKVCMSAMQLSRPDVSSKRKHTWQSWASSSAWSRQTFWSF